ncbi:NADH-quinone oxidoreductase subunit F, partial [Candidatus Bathyarchaeota archaeon]|nr:NADH-quinone oxidoreductase subunit F [Candidatus Bathyarchaeota archaeon]
IDDQSCLIDTAKFFIDFCVAESCGKCTPCRVGLVKIKEIFKKIMQGEGKIEDINLLSKLSTFITETSLCGLGQTAPNPVLTTLRYFKQEYVEHLVDRSCKADKCFKENKGVNIN